MEACYAGFDYKSINDWEIIIKLDADLVLPSNYLESTINQFNCHSKTGICGGVCVLENNGSYNIEKETNLDHVRGAIKAYRRQCFEDIGGLTKHMGWIP